LPTFLVLPGPQFHCLFVFEDMSVCRIRVKSFLRTYGNIAQLAQQCTDMSAQYICIKRSSGFDPFKEILKMHAIEYLRRIGFVSRINLHFILDVLHDIVFQIKHLVSITSTYHDGTFLTIKNHAYAGTFDVLSIAASTFPGHRTVLTKFI